MSTRRAIGGTAIVTLALVAAGCTGPAPGPDATTDPTPPSAAADVREDVRALVRHVRSTHPDPFHDVPREAFLAEARRLEDRAGTLGPEELLVELMRLATLGDRDGHSGIFPLDQSLDAELHLYPLRLYRFEEGTHVVAAASPHGDLVGGRLLEVSGIPVYDAWNRIEPLVPHDNRSTLLARIPQFLVVAEVLRGLGIAASPTSASFTVASPGGGRSTVKLEALPAGEWIGALGSDLWHPMMPPTLPSRPGVPYLRNTDEEWSATTIGDGRAVYAQYNVTLGDTETFADEIRRLARRHDAAPVVLDLRHNPGGDNGTYPPVREALSSDSIDRPDRLFVLVGRTTFSAAGQLVTELDQETSARLVGEPTGSSPNFFGDPVSVTLPNSGLVVQTASVHWETGGASDRRLTTAPDIRAPVSAEDFFSGRDRALEAALDAGR